MQHQTPFTPSPTTPPTTLQTWTQAFEVLKIQKKQLIKLGLGSVFLPYLALVVIFGRLSQSGAEALAQVSGPGYQAYLEPVYTFCLNYLALGAVFLGIVTAGFLASVRLCLAYFRSEELTAQAAFKDGLQLSFPHGLIILTVCACFSLEQYFLGPFRIFTLMGLMAAVLLVAERQNGFRCLQQALLFRYSSPAFGSGFTSAFILVGLSALVFAGELSLGFIYQAIMQADSVLGVSRSLWATPLPGLAMSGMHLVAKIAYGLGLTFLLALIAAFLVSLFYRVRPRISHLV